MPFDCIIFDLDGTLLDTLQDLASGVNHALSMHALPARTTSEIRSFVGNGVRNLVARASGFDTGDSRFGAIFSEFRNFYADHCNDSTTPYPGITDTLERLRSRDIPLAVLSNKQDREVRLLAEKFFPGIFSLTFGEQEGFPRKPAPDSLLHIIRELGSDRSKALYIGDSEVDVMTASRAGVIIAAASWGFRTKDELRTAGASLLIDSPLEILDLL